MPHFTAAGILSSSMNIHHDSSGKFGFELTSHFRAIVRFGLWEKHDDYLRGFGAKKCCDFLTEAAQRVVHCPDASAVLVVRTNVGAVFHRKSTAETKYINVCFGG